MWHWSLNRKNKANNNRGQDSGRLSVRCVSMVVVTLFLVNGASILYGITQTSDVMMALPYILVHHTFLALCYAIAYSSLVRRGFFTSNYFLVSYHVLLGTMTFMHTYLYYLVRAAVQGGTYFPGWLHLNSVKSVAYSSSIWYSIHLVFLLSAIVLSRLTSKR